MRILSWGRSKIRVGSSRYRRLRYQIIHGADVDFAGKRACLFSTFDRESRIDAYVFYYLRALRDAGISVILISSNSDLSDRDLEAAKQICEAIILRENIGLDFAGWAIGIRQLSGILRAKEIIIANDSVYGPLYPIASMFDGMARIPCDAWGVTQNFEVDWHVQSYFLVFREKAIRSPAFLEFWKSVRALKKKEDVINRYEIPLAKFFRDRGVMVYQYVNVLMGEYLSGNPTLVHWDRIILEGRSPFIKRELLRDNPRKVDISRWPDILSSVGYDPSIVRDHLARISADLS